MPEDVLKSEGERRDILPHRIHGTGIVPYIWMIFYGKCSHGSFGLGGTKNWRGRERASERGPCAVKT